MGNDELKQQMAMFEAARIAAPVEVAPTLVTGVLAVFDGTDQDATVQTLAAAFAARTGATVREFRSADDEPHAAILAAAKGCQVLVVPSPFRRDYATEGQQSLAATVDLLLARSEAAICLARAPVADAGRCLAHPLLALQVERHKKLEAAAMALALAQHGGELLLLSVVDPQQPVHGEELLGRNLDPKDLSPEVLQALANARAAALTAALQKHAHEWHTTVRVHFGLGDAVALALAENERRGGILVAGRNRDGTTVAAQDARRLVLASRWPVLLV